MEFFVVRCHVLGTHKYTRTQVNPKSEKNKKKKSKREKKYFKPTILRLVCVFCSISR